MLGSIQNVVVLDCIWFGCRLPGLPNWRQVLSTQASSMAGSMGENISLPRCHLSERSSFSSCFSHSGHRPSKLFLTYECGCLPLLFLSCSRLTSRGALGSVPGCLSPTSSHPCWRSRASGTPRWSTSSTPRNTAWRPQSQSWPRCALRAPDSVRELNKRKVFVSRNGFMA